MGRNVKDSQSNFKMTGRYRKILLISGIVLSVFCSANAWSQAAPGSSGLKQAIIRYDSVHHPVAGRFGMVVTQNSIASSVGQGVLEKGGNAVDAAVAVGFALAVTLPRAGNLGGSGFMLVHDTQKKETVALDYRSVAPLAANIDKFSKPGGGMDWDKLTFGPLASAVPGTVAAMYQAWQRFGSLPWKDLLEPAHRLAGEGFRVGHDLANVLNMAAGSSGPSR